MPGSIKKYNIDLYYLSAFSFAVFSGFYLAKLTAVSPVYLFFAFGIITAFLMTVIKRTVRADNIITAPYIFVIYLLVTQVLLAPLFNTLLNVMFSLMYLICMPLSFTRLSREKLVKISVALIKFSVVILVFEACYRLTHPIFQLEGSTVDYSESEDLVFYAYKINSLMFQDSNFVGLYALVILFFTDYIRKFQKKISIFWLISLVLIIAGTLSRAAMVSAVLTYTLLWFIGYRLRPGKVLILSMLGILIGAVIVNLLLSDPSLQSKFMILELTKDFMNKADFADFLFGIGLGNTKELLGIGAHNFIVTYLMETGLIGLLIQLAILIELLIWSKTRAWPIIIAFLIAGMSLAGHAISFLYAVVYLVIVLEDKSRQDILDTVFPAKAIE